MGGLLDSSVGRATSLPRKIGVLPEDADSLKGIEARLRGKKKKELKDEDSNSRFLSGGFF